MLGDNMKVNDKIKLNELFDEMIDNVSYLKRITILKSIKK